MDDLKNYRCSDRNELMNLIAERNLRLEFSKVINHCGCQDCGKNVEAGNHLKFIRLYIRFCLQKQGFLPLGNVGSLEAPVHFIYSYRKDDEEEGVEKRRNDNKCKKITV